MGTGAKVAIGFVVVCVLILVISVVTTVSTYNQAVSYEAGIEAQYKQNQNLLAAHSNKVMEVAQVPGMYAKDMQNLIKTEMTAKFGEGGSKAMFQWFKERDLNFDSSLYKKIMQVMEAGRDDFAAGQKSMASRTQEYTKYHKGAWPGFLVRAFGFPSEEVKTWSVIVTNDYTEEAFKTGKSEAIKIGQ